MSDECEKIKQFFITLGAFLILGVSFKVMVLVEGLTEVRPVNAIPPVTGMLWGTVGAFACGIGNLLADLAGTVSLASILGVAANFLAAWLPYRLWYLWMEEKPNLHSGKSRVGYVLVCAVSAMAVAWVLAFGLYFWQGIWMEEIYRYVLFNNLGFSIGLGMPVLIMLTSDCVRITYAGPPGKILFLKNRKHRKIVSVSLGMCMAVFCLAVIAVGASPKEAEWMFPLSVAAAVLMVLLV